MENKDTAKAKLAKTAEEKADERGSKRSKQEMIDRATEPEWYGVTSF